MVEKCSVPSWHIAMPPGGGVHPIVRSHESAYPLGPRFAGPRQGLAGGCAPSDPPNGNGTSWTLDAGGGLAPLPSRRRVLMADRRTVAAGRFVAENH